MSLSTHILRPDGERTLCGLRPATATLSLTDDPTKVTCRSCEFSLERQAKP